MAPKDQEPLFCVELEGAENHGRQFDIGPDGLLVGRSDTCDVIFESPEVSRRHAYFYPDRGVCCVEDLGSKNGLLVNGRREKRLRLSDGDTVVIGPCRFHLRVVRGDTVGSVVSAPWQGMEERRAGREAEARASHRHPLAIASVVFGLMAYLHWAFGVCAVISAVLCFWELRGSVKREAVVLAQAGIVLGVAGAAMNVWFAEIAPGLREKRMAEARELCQANLLQVHYALEAYREEHGQIYPRRLNELVALGLLNKVNLSCPGYRLDERRRHGYLFLRAALGLAAQPRDPVVCDHSQGAHQGRGGWILRANGTTVWMPRQQFIAFLTRLRENARRKSPGKQEASTE